MIFCDYFNILNTEWLWEERPERDASGRELLEYWDGGEGIEMKVFPFHK